MIHCIVKVFVFSTFSNVFSDLFNVHDPGRRLKDAPLSPSINQDTRNLDRNYADNSRSILPINNPWRKSSPNRDALHGRKFDVNNAQIGNVTRVTRFPKRIEDEFRERLRQLKSQLFTDELGAGSDSICAVPMEMVVPVDICPSEAVKWRCEMAPTFSVLNSKRR